MKKTIAVIALLTVPALASAQAGLSKIQFLALQQELRDQGCGVTNVDGQYGPQTRRAIATCAKKFNSGPLSEKSPCRSSAEGTRTWWIVSPCRFRKPS